MTKDKTSAAVAEVLRREAVFHLDAVLKKLLSGDPDNDAALHLVKAEILLSYRDELLENSAGSLAP